MNAAVKHPKIAEEDRLRADMYDFLGALLARPPGQDLLAQTAALSGNESPLGQAVSALARVAGAVNPLEVEQEFTDLFIGLGRGELLPYASFYLTGFLNEKPLAALRRDMRALGIGRAPGRFEPEDNIASLCEMMAGMIRGRFGAPVALARQKEFFSRHIAPWAAHFFADLETAPNSAFYAAVGAVGGAFAEIEREAFRMSAG